MKIRHYYAWTASLIGLANVQAAGLKAVQAMDSVQPELVKSFQVQKCNRKLRIN
jgi:hypothetical protein